MEFRYGLDERPPLGPLLLFGLQWLAVALPGILILGRVVGTLQYSTYGNQVLYLQKLCFVTGITLFCQVLAGHRLPLIAGPSTVLLIGVIASRSVSVDAVYSTILLGGLALALASVSGLFRYLQRLFTPPVVATVLLLIGFNLAPTLQHLIIGTSAASSASHLVFALAFLLLMFLAQSRLSGIWKSTLIVWALVVGTALYPLLFRGTESGTVSSPASPVAGIFHHLTTRLVIDPGVLISFFFCYLALSINDLGSIQAMAELLKPAEMPRRITRGVAFTGMANALAGFLGVLGPVDFSLSPGVVAATGCASRYTLLPAALSLLVLSFSPLAIGVIGHIPSVVIGCVLTYILCAQIAAGLSVLFQGNDFRFEHGLTVGLSLLLGTLVAFLPPEVLSSFPVTLRPTLGNGFVVGVLAALILEHVIFRTPRG